MSIGALVLAAGESTRFGTRPKALEPVDGRSAVRRIAETALGCDFDPVVVVVGAHREPIVHDLRGLRVSVVEAREWFEGRTASVQAGLAALPEGADVLFWPVDHPFVEVRTVELLATFPTDDPLVVWFIPTFQGKSGHPVVWRSTLRRDLLELRADAPIRALLPEFGPQVRRIPVEDPGVVANVDTPEAFRLARESWASRGGY